jgi:hypothetical protein
VSCLRGNAYISRDGLYRYSLTREVRQTGRGTCTFIGLNPSTADAERDDPTTRRSIAYARAWGFAQLTMVNLYAFRATNPRDLWLVEDPVGPENDQMLSVAFGGSDLIVAAWGAQARPERLTAFAERFGDRPLHALGITTAGAPRHPLYLRADAQPFAFRGGR